MFSLQWQFQSSGDDFNYTTCKLNSASQFSHCAVYEVNEKQIENGHVTFKTEQMTNHDCIHMGNTLLTFAHLIRVQVHRCCMDELNVSTALSYL